MNSRTMQQPRAEDNGAEQKEAHAQLTPLERCARYEELGDEHGRELLELAGTLLLHVVHMRANLPQLIGREGYCVRPFAHDLRDRLTAVWDAACALERVAECVSHWDHVESDAQGHPLFYRGEPFDSPRGLQDRVPTNNCSG